MVGYRDRPALGEGGADQQKIELRHRADGLGVSPQGIRRETAGRHSVDGALIRQQRAGLARSHVRGDDHRRHGRLRFAVHVHRPVQQLGGGGPQPYQAEKRHLDIA